jgi:DNA modification methylase
MNRKYLGSEISKKYIKIAKDRLKNAEGLFSCSSKKKKIAMKGK